MPAATGATGANTDRRRGFNRDRNDDVREPEGRNPGPVA